MAWVRYYTGGKVTLIITVILATVLGLIIGNYQPLTQPLGLIKTSTIVRQVPITETTTINHTITTTTRALVNWTITTTLYNTSIITLPPATVIYNSTVVV
ncbi:hypothetical protein, partial [Caldivirga sp.]|uniref:hypothetical protein n=1 Tax=Caldivirga sp. TaxID=2080243 RepID=UPI003D142003